MENQDSMIRKVLETAKTIAIVGLSPDEKKPSNVVARYLMDKGYTIIPVNPQYQEILGKTSYKSLFDIPLKVDIVDIFMRADTLLPVVKEAVKIQPKCIWLQLGIINHEAKKLAEEHGIAFVMDRCVKIEHARLKNEG